MAKLLTPKQHAFIREYLVDFNATQAARRAGYQGSDATLSAIGSQNLRKHPIQDAIQNYLAENSLSIEEVIYRLTRQARGSLGDLITIDPDGKYTFDLDKGFETGAIDLVEKIIISASTGRDGSYKRRLHVRLYSAQKALFQIGKAYGLWQGQLPHDKPRLDGGADSSTPMLEETIE